MRESPGRRLLRRLALGCWMQPRRGIGLRHSGEAFHVDMAAPFGADIAIFDLSPVVRSPAL